MHYYDLVLAEVWRRHAEPGRHHHNWRRVIDLLRQFIRMRPGISHPEAFRLAILFQDAIYDTTRTDNEERSAALLESRPYLSSLGASVDFAAKMIRATKTHELPNGMDASEQADLALFLDMDLSIFGSDPERYQQYEAAIAQEYPHVPIGEFLAKRADILERFMARDRIYLTPAYHDRLERLARENLSRSVQSIREPGRRVLKS